MIQEEEKVLALLKKKVRYRIVIYVYTDCFCL